jgi:hypothetical protein
VLRAARESDADALRSSGATAGRAHLRSRTLFVGTEFAFSVVLLIGAGLLIKTFSRITSEPLGFHTRDVFVASVTLPNRSYSNVNAEVRFSENALERLRMLPSVRAAGVGRVAVPSKWAGSHRNGRRRARLSRADARGC